MPRLMTNSSADKFLVYAFLAWFGSCIHPSVGLLMQLPIIAYLVYRCDVKTLPALLVLMFSKSNIRLFDEMGEFALRFGITWTPTSCLTIAAFFVAIKVVFTAGQSGTMIMGVLWLLTAIPAFVMSIPAKQYGLSGVWSGPIMTFLIPSVYFWGLAMASTYKFGKEYLFRRLFQTLLVVNVLLVFMVIKLHTFSAGSLLFCLSLLLLRTRNPKWRKFKIAAWVAIPVILFNIVFSRGMDQEAAAAATNSANEVVKADKYGSTFTAMICFLFAWMMASGFGKGLSKSFDRALPILMVVVNVAFVSFVVSTQSGNKAVDVNFRYETLEERVKWKLYGDRAGVWTMGWEEVKTPPLVFKDLRQFWEMDDKGGGGLSFFPIINS